MLGFLAALIFALSLCADCFAVATCSSVTLRQVSWRSVLGVSLVFAFVHISLLLAGWAFGDLFVGFIGKIAPVLGFLLLAYVGGSMLVDAWRNSPEVRNLSGLRNILLGAVATSIDAFATGISLSMDRDSFGDMAVKATVLFFVTLLTVGFGIKGGQLVGRRYGRGAQVAGGIVLLCIGLNILIKAFGHPLVSL
ncbi:MAG: manganese efflux pump [Bacteroidales bacterium]|nr:manganese efflux pump [Bacteroidales bacterium]